MKRLLSIILALLVVSAFTMTAYADECAGTGESTISAHVYSQYMISIPSIIDLRDGNTSSVTASNVNLEDGYEINVYVTNLYENCIILENYDDNKVNRAQVSLQNLETQQMIYDSETPLASFTKANFKDTNISCHSFGLYLNNYGVPGDYTGIMQYRFECVEAD